MGSQWTKQASPLELLAMKTFDEIVDMAARADVMCGGHLLTESKLRRLLQCNAADAEDAFKRLDVRHEMRVDLSMLLVGMGLAADAEPSEKVAFVFRVLDPGRKWVLDQARGHALIEFALRGFEAFFGIRRVHTDVKSIVAEIAGVELPENRQEATLTFAALYRYCADLPGFFGLLRQEKSQVGEILLAADVAQPTFKEALESAEASAWMQLLVCPRSRLLSPVRGCPRDLNPNKTGNRFTVIRKPERMDPSPTHEPAESATQSTSLATAKSRTNMGKDDYFDALSPEQVRDLFAVFSRIDSTASGIVVMEDFLATLQKSVKADATGFLRQCCVYFRRSVTADRLLGFKTFKSILELLLPAVSSAEVDDLLARVSKAKPKKLTRAQTRLQKIAKIGLLSQRAATAFHEDSDTDEDDEQDKKEISMDRAFEYLQIFDSLANGTGKITEQQLYDAMGDVMNHNERRAFFAKYVRKMRLKRNEETTKRGFDCGLYNADFETFVSMIVPRGYKFPQLPDPDRHIASHEDLWQLFYSKQTPKTAQGQVRGQTSSKITLPQLERNEKAGRPLPRKIYQQREVQEKRHIVQNIEAVL
jgi:hypothetical protein